jgi:hypothetical protein
VFSIKFQVEGAMDLWVWGWDAIAFSKEHVLISEWDNLDFYGFNITPWIPTPLGLVSRDNILQSAALLLMHCSKSEIPADRFGGGEGGANFWHQITVSGIDTINLYRVLLAAQGRGGLEILQMDDESLMNYKEEDMTRGYEDLEGIVEYQMDGGE